MEWPSILVISHVVLWIVVLLQALLLLALARLVGQLMSRRFPAGGARVIDPGPEIGSVVDGWETTDLLGNPLRVHFPRERDLFLLYVSPHCRVCAGLLPPAKRFLKEIFPEAEGFWVMVLGSRESQLNYARANGLIEQPVLAEELLPGGWRLGGGPFALWINSAGEVLAKGMVNTREHLESLRNAALMGHASVESYVSSQAEEVEQQRERAHLTEST